MITENFLDEDVAYLLGLIVMRGQLYDHGSERGIVIEFPFKSLQVAGYDQELYLQLGVNRIRDRIQELVESFVKVEQSGNLFVFSVRFLQHPVTWRNLQYHLGKRKSYREFQVPASIMNAPRAIQIEFMRGVADVGGFIRDSNRYIDGRRRVYLEVHNHNWILPLQLCALLQQKLNVSVQLIQWGHSNTREPQGGSHWSREHQVKIFAQAFEPIGFTIKYKNETLRKFARQDRKIRSRTIKCNPNPDIRRIHKKKKHPEEKNAALPTRVRGKHFDAYWQICLALGCKQCVKTSSSKPLVQDVNEELEVESE
ncbi:MAG: hypothetical protein HY327_02330 [Chloroflexi bacterium]|nr:hypothetical protein [Chloroflexota bacterium]